MACPPPGGDYQPQKRVGQPSTAEAHCGPISVQTVGRGHPSIVTHSGWPAVAFCGGASSFGEWVKNFIPSGARDLGCTDAAHATDSAGAPEIPRCARDKFCVKGRDEPSPSREIMEW